MGIRPLDKHPLTTGEQLQLFRERRLTILNDQRARRPFQVVDFFRLSPYIARTSAAETATVSVPPGWFILIVRFRRLSGKSWRQVVECAGI